MGDLGHLVARTNISISESIFDYYYYF